MTTGRINQVSVVTNLRTWPADERNGERPSQGEEGVGSAAKTGRGQAMKPAHDAATLRAVLFLYHTRRAARVSHRPGLFHRIVARGGTSPSTHPYIRLSSCRPPAKATDPRRWLVLRATFVASSDRHLRSPVIPTVSRVADRCRGASAESVASASSLSGQHRGRVGIGAPSRAGEIRGVPNR